LSGLGSVARAAFRGTLGASVAVIFEEASWARVSTVADVLGTGCGDQVATTAASRASRAVHSSFARVGSARGMAGTPLTLESIVANVTGATHATHTSTTIRTTRTVSAVVLRAVLVWERIGCGQAEAVERRIRKDGTHASGLTLREVAYAALLAVIH
jgi:hypothetical protein